ncbi:MAG: TetR/AcrR family transcriptional regulator [Lawsonibacter sp.]|jgi:AcrR family transcriptional regulator
MARKAYSEQEREQVRNALLTTVIQCIVDRGLIHSSIDVLCKKVGISKTFFYTFFSSKEELVLEALRYQQPKLLQYARQLMEDPALSWREGVRTFLETCSYGEKRGVAVLSIEEEQEIYRCLSQENFQTFREDQTKLFRDLLEIFGLPVDGVDPRLFGNLALSMMMVYKAIPDTMPFLFPEVAEDMVAFQISALLDEMQRVKENGNGVKQYAPN